MNQNELALLLHEFKTSYADLMVHKPRVEISSFPQIYVWHPFIFDNRLIPQKFKGVKVINVTISSSLPASLNPPDDKPLWKVEDPGNYINFVEEHFKVIREKLGSPSMTKIEMLDVLTGNFVRHVLDWHKNVCAWLTLTEN